MRIAKTSRLVIVASLVSIMLPMVATVSNAAQSPVPTNFSLDTPPGGPFPSISGEPHAANAVVVEGLGGFSCGDYSTTSIEYAASNRINANEETIIEISPQSTCGTLSQYEGEISAIASYVESHTTNPGQYWGLLGFVWVT